MSSSITSDNTSDKDRAAKGDDNAADATNKKRTASDADLSVNADHRIATRREANRMHALKSRQRSKALLQELQNSVTVLNGEKADLERQNAILRAQVDVLSQQNRALLQSQQQMMAGGAGQMAQGMPLDMNNQQQDQLLLGSLPQQPEQHRSQPQPQQQPQQQPLQAIDPQSQLNMAQQQLFAAYSGAALPNFGFLPQPFAFDANTLSLMQSLQQVQQMQQQQNQQTIMQQQPPLPVQEQAQQLPQQPMSRQESLEPESDQLGSLQSDSEGANDDQVLTTNEV